MTTETTPATVAASFAESAAMNSSLEATLAELERARASITGVRPPVADLKESYDQLLERYAAVRGKPALYPYVGSGMGNGPLVELLDGSVKWDMINGIGVHMFGHGDPEITATAVRAAMGDMLMQGNLQFNAEAIEFCELIVGEAAKSSNIKYCFPTNSGAMANESALKVCFQKNTPASRVIAFAHCFMGRSTTMAQIGDSAAGRVGLPLNTLVDYMPFYDPQHGQRSIDHAFAHLQAYIERYPRQHACFVMELVQGEGGFNIAPKEFFEPLMKLCKDNGIAVWADEVQTFGRTTEMFYFDHLGLGDYVDVVTIGKMSQVCACLFTEDYNPQSGLLSGTFIGSTPGLRVGTHALRRLRDGGYYGPDGHIATLHKAFCEHCKALVDKHPDWFPPIRHGSHLAPMPTEPYGGVGGMMRFTPFGGHKGKIQKALRCLFEDGIIAFYCGHGPFHIRFLPPVGVMQPRQFDDVFEIVEGALARAALRD